MPNSKTFTPEEIRELISELRDPIDPFELTGQAADALQYLLQFVEWRPVETAPTNVATLLYCPDRGIANRERIELGFYRTERGQSGSVHSWATHFLPLPPPPQEKKEGEQ